MPLSDEWSLSDQWHFFLKWEIFFSPTPPQFSNFPFFYQQNHSAIALILLPTWKNLETLFWIIFDNSLEYPLEPTEVSFTLFVGTDTFPTIVPEVCAYSFQVAFLEMNMVKRRNILDSLLCKSFWHSFHISVGDENWSAQSRSRTPKRHSDCLWFFYLEVQRAWVSSLKEEEMSYLKK